MFMSIPLDIEDNTIIKPINAINVTNAHIPDFDVALLLDSLRFASKRMNAIHTIINLRHETLLTLSKGDIKTIIAACVALVSYEFSQYF